jgi:hypothetical protein
VKKQRGRFTLEVAVGTYLGSSNHISCSETLRQHPVVSQSKRIIFLPLPSRHCPSLSTPGTPHTETNAKLDNVGISFIINPHTFSLAFACDRHRRTVPNKTLIMTSRCRVLFSRTLGPRFPKYVGSNRRALSLDGSGGAHKPDKDNAIPSNGRSDPTAGVEPPSTYKTRLRQLMGKSLQPPGT